ncbi:uncharacterized protein PRCAT00000832001 [Priceomyces carsonii]|uniref:uncharacterized protein n=1 Tax=Priceomyces carsonii TaxID=28549 RepID=UPI002EDAD922|nr:unnamed protein product [Priceomyces carsonii]
MLKTDDFLYVSFEPSDTKLLTSVPNTQLLSDYPLLTSALSNIFPYLLLIDNFLEVITWTNEDPYQNFLLAVVYSVLVMYWHTIGGVALPLLMAVSFSCVVWSVSSVIYDSTFDEKPTVDEVLHTLHNITVRCEMLFRPVQHFDLKKKNFVTAFLMATLLTPLHLLVIKTFLGPQKYFWILGLFFFTYHSPWSFSARRLLWRSVYIRIIAFYITGLDIKLDRRKPKFENDASPGVHSAYISDGDEYGRTPLLSDFKITKKSKTSATQLKQVVRFEVLENERRWLGIGWSKILFPSERSNYCSENSMLPSPPISDDYPFPVFENDLYSYLWEWVDLQWKLDKEFDKGRDPEGWVYSDSNWTNQSFKDGFSKYTRSRKWIRHANLTIDKQDIVYDE